MAKISIGTLATYWKRLYDWIGVNAKPDVTVSGTADVAIKGSSIAYDPADDMFKIKSLQKKWRDSFPGAALDSAKWDLLQTGSGHTVTVTGGQLIVATGTTINSETIIQSKEYFTVPTRALFGFSISQKIANQEFYLELVSIDPVTGDADGKHGMSWKMDNTGASAAYAIYEVWNSGLARLSSAATSGNTWTAMSIKELELFADEAWFHDRTIDSSSGRTNSWVRHQQIPDPGALYKVRLRAKNLGSAPASSTNLTLQFACVVDYAELTAEITAGRGNAVSGQGLFATVTGTTTANIGTKSELWYTDTTTNLGTSATYTGTIRDVGSTSSMNYSRARVMVRHLAGSIPGQLIFEQSESSSMATIRETHRIPIPSDGKYRVFEFPLVQRYVRIKFVNGTTAQTGMCIASTMVKWDGFIDYPKELVFIDSTTNLTGGSTFTGASLDLGGTPLYEVHRAHVYADQAGTLYMEQSRDGTTWRIIQTQAVALGEIKRVEVPILMEFVRVRYTNGATGQGAFELVSSLA